MEAVAFAAIITLGIAMIWGIPQMKPETPQQRYWRLYREAEEEDRRIWEITNKAIKRHLNPNAKPMPYRPNKKRIQRRMRERARD